MHNIKALTLFTVLLMTGCQSIDSTDSQMKFKQGSEPFFTYSILEEPRTVIAIAMMGEFRYEDGCLSIFNGVELMTPAFPEGDAKFDLKTQTLKIIDTEYKMGEVVIAGGNSVSNNLLKDSEFDKNIPSKCVKENVAVFFGDYEKTTWNKK
ncbi:MULTISPECIES: hypothetical protein [Psychrobacter]|uniref:hypothetical protein n=1 Tax=Psychrobacter TaxID=497 RepID=UPI003FD53499